MVEGKDAVVAEDVEEKGSNFTDALDAKLMKSLEGWKMLIPIGYSISELVEVKIVWAVVSAHVDKFSISLGPSFLEFLRAVREHLKHKVEPVFVLISGTCVDCRPKEAGISHIK